MPSRGGTAGALLAAIVEVEVDDADTNADVPELDDDMVVAFFWYMFNQAGPPQYWFAFAAQTILHEPVVEDIEPDVIVSPQ